MADAPTDLDELADGPPPLNPSIRVIAQYIRDLSFENPNAPSSLVAEDSPKIELEVGLNAGHDDGNQYQLELKLVVHAHRPEKTAFHVELIYGGVFLLYDTPEELIEQMLLVECPRYLFPFARRIISELTMEGGFAPFRIEPLDFMSMYLARQQKELANA